MAAAQTGPPCFRCRLRKWDASGSICRSPVYADQRYDTEDGRLITTYSAKCADARSPLGHCGPEALLFEPYSKAQQIGFGLGLAALAAPAALMIFL